jgi:hypothetical protein
LPKKSHQKKGAENTSGRMQFNDSPAAIHGPRWA